MLLTIGSKIYDNNENEYEILEPLGEGGFGAVFKVKSQGNFFALKTLPSYYPDENSLNSFIMEAKSALELDHHNIIKYMYFHDGKTFDKLPPYIIMELANKGTLEELIKSYQSKQTFQENDVLTSILMQLIDGIEAVNEKLVHRDIKPQNILINDDIFKISDFGLSKFVNESTRTKTFKGWGTSKYIAPEAWKSEKNTIQMDIYSMGIVFYELCTLKYPYEISTNQDFEELHLFANPNIPQKINPNISPVLSQVILKMLDKNPSNRFNNWNDIRIQLNNSNPPAKDSDIAARVNAALQIKIAQENKAQEEELKRQERSNEIKKFKKIVEYQVENDILAPIKKFINDYNEQYISGNKISVKKVFPSSDSPLYTITTSSMNRMELEIETILEENSYVTRDIPAYRGGYTTKKVLELPRLKGKPVQAWGYLKNKSGEGYNLILVKDNEEDIYGNWYMFINTNSGLSTQRRYPEPFAFDLRELREEINKINAIHAYQTSVSPLDAGTLIDLLIKYNSIY